MSEAIGSYFGLELQAGGCYHDDLIDGNTGRNALQYIFKGRKFKHIYIPFYTCDVLLEPLKRLGIAYVFL